MSENKVSGINKGFKNMQKDDDDNIRKNYICTSVETFTKNGFKAITEAIRNSNVLPTDRDWDFYKLNNSFSTILENEGNRMLRQMNTILRNYELDDNIRVKGFDEKMELLVEANDTILERVSDNIDELNGIKKKTIAPVEYQTVSAELPISGSWNRLNRATFSVSSSISSLHNNKQTVSQAIRLLTGKNIIRPQTFFNDKIDNSNNPWQPRITEKPNSIKPLALYVEETIFGETFSHPYEIELQQFNPPVEQLSQISPVKPLALSKTPLHEISTSEKLNELLDELRKHSEIAVDLEHHSYRTFMGITCLLQISTKDADYLIDTLQLRDKLYVLNEVFTRPSIVKIFHGADSDIQWLQRDLSLYIVNMFDTHQAAKQLGYSSLSLAYLLNRFCKFVPNKQFQLADWRIRPLPDELKNYAREDTHYLIYIYHMLRNELLKLGNGSDNILKAVIQKSTEICQKRYYKPILREDSHLDFYRKCRRLFDNRQMYALKELYQWRDKISREEDESTGYVLPNHMLLQISEMLPREVQGILACCNPIPPLVRSNLLELHQIILRARDQSVEKPIMKEDNRDKGSTQQFSKLNIESPLHCPHDLTKQQDFRDDLPTLLESKNSETDMDDSLSPVVKNEIEKTKASISVFDMFDSDVSSETDFNTIQKINNLKFLGPYERYKLVKPYIQAEENKAVSAQSVPDDSKDEAEDRTDEDRIASLHQHFLKVAKANPQKMQEDTNLGSDMLGINNNQPLQEFMPMDGFRVKKRKRNEPVESQPVHDRQLDETIYSEDVNDVDVKRKRNNDEVEIDYNTKSNFSKRRRTRGQNYYHKKQDSNQYAEDNYSNFTNQREQEYIEQPTKPKKNRNNRKSQRMNKKNKNAYSQSNQSAPGGNNFAAFDYSSVNYQQFHGGAGSASSNNMKVQSNFKQKNKNRMQGRNGDNKFATFKNRRSRGRGGY